MGNPLVFDKIIFVTHPEGRRRYVVDTSPTTKETETIVLVSTHRVTGGATNTELKITTMAFTSEPVTLPAREPESEAALLVRQLKQQKPNPAYFGTQKERKKW